MAVTGRGQARTSSNSKSPPFILVGLLIVIVILAFNYYNLSKKNAFLLDEKNTQTRSLIFAKKRITDLQSMDRSHLNELENKDKTIRDLQNSLNDKDGEIKRERDQYTIKLDELTKCQGEIKNIEEIKQQLDQETENKNTCLKELTEKSMKESSPDNCNSTLEQCLLETKRLQKLTQGPNVNSPSGSNLKINPNPSSLLTEQQPQQQPQQQIPGQQQPHQQQQSQQQPQQQTQQQLQQQLQQQPQQQIQQQPQQQIQQPQQQLHQQSQQPPQQQQQQPLELQQQKEQQPQQHFQEKDQLTTINNLETKNLIQTKTISPINSDNLSVQPSLDNISKKINFQQAIHSSNQQELAINQNTDHPNQQDSSKTNLNQSNQPNSNIQSVANNNEQLKELDQKNKSVNKDEGNSIPSKLPSQVENHVNNNDILNKVAPLQQENTVKNLETESTRVPKLTLDNSFVDSSRDNNGISNDIKPPSSLTQNNPVEPEQFNPKQSFNPHSANNIKSVDNFNLEQDSIRNVKIEDSENKFNQVEKFAPVNKPYENDVKMLDNSKDANSPLRLSQHMEQDSIPRNAR